MTAIKGPKPAMALLNAALLFLCLFAPGLGAGDRTGVARHRGLNRYLAVEGERAGREAWERIGSREKLEAGRDQLRREFLFMIGLWPLPERSPLQAQVVRSIDRGDYTVEVLQFQSLPGFYVTANLYLPAKGRKPFPAMIWGPGHSTDNEYGAKTRLQRMGAGWARNGYACLLLDPVQVAEVFAVHRGTAAWELRDWYARGYTSIGIEVWNAMRAVDYLQSRGDIAPERIGITGVSGGGHLSWMAGAADPRLAVVQPAAGTADVETHVKLDLQGMHCDCAYFINTYRHDWTTLAALIAPRPLLMHNSTGDDYYPPVGYKQVLERAKTIFSWYGAADKVAMDEVAGPHGYTQEQREQAIRWNDRWFFGRNRKVREPEVENLPEAQLSALGGLFAAPKDAINPRIHELLIPTAALERPADRPAWEARRAEVLKNLREVVFRNLPRPANVRVAQRGERETCTLETEPGVEVGMLSYVPEEEGPRLPALLYIASPGDKPNDVMWSYLNKYPFQRNVASRHLLYPRGVGAGLWDAVTRKHFERTAMVLGRTLDEMRLYDILAAVEQIASRPDYDGSGITVAGRGEAGILGAYAALLDERITRVILQHPTVSHEEGPIFLNVLRYTDIPQVLAMLAPRELVLLSHQPAEFGYTREVYELMGAGSALRRCSTVTQALNLKP